MLALLVMFVGLVSCVLSESLEDRRGASDTLADTSARVILLLSHVGIPRHSMGVAHSHLGWDQSHSSLLRVAQIDERIRRDA